MSIVSAGCCSPGCARITGRCERGVLGDGLEGHVVGTWWAQYRSYLLISLDHFNILRASKTWPVPIR